MAGEYEVVRKWAEAQLLSDPPRGYTWRRTDVCEVAPDGTALSVWGTEAGYIWRLVPVRRWTVDLNMVRGRGGVISCSADSNNVLTDSDRLLAERVARLLNAEDEIR